MVLMRVGDDGNMEPITEEMAVHLRRAERLVRELVGSSDIRDIVMQEAATRPRLVMPEPHVIPEPKHVMPEPKHVMPEPMLMLIDVMPEPKHVMPGLMLMDVMPEPKHVMPGLMLMDMPEPKHVMPFPFPPPPPPENLMQHVAKQVTPKPLQIVRPPMFRQMPPRPFRGTITAVPKRAATAPPRPPPKAKKMPKTDRERSEERRERKRRREFKDPQDLD